ncbi:Mitochondrial thiamine pyrophosphate carrier 1 [Hondaea fermentalgiana]|uniref:Mitochondrial thiamine pyrophosphate carrier 1 n=1 Tax=Hondaea fermentalgiana TaxID=2315210 RepID=A0A2R5GF75_9STRA|nr:Mitochondrial thiamine pyrophosphate carrier 1 [Hondaea fermentalgiana]|eukprot:GBG28388.1 Mitochondrial thiamine pyrophosphate carrier 1 [Hondaea fermentalgiana]
MAPQREHFSAYLAASAGAAAVNYPLWKASAVSQSAFIQPQGDGLAARFQVFKQAIAPPYRGMPAVIFGMTWARCAIFFGSDYWRPRLQQWGAPDAVAMMTPPLVFSSIVQIVNMPIVRASITMQNPKVENDPNFRTTVSTLRHLAETKGFFKLWHGLPAGLIKSVPKYITSVVVKDLCEMYLPKASTESEFLTRSCIKSVVAGVAGAVLTNPADILRNEMFKTDLGLFDTVRKLRTDELARRPNASSPFLASMGWVTRGLGSNLVAVSVPITLTIFLTDFFIRMESGPNYVR